MLAKRIIPCLDVQGGRVVKGVNFVGLRDAGDPVAQARRYSEEGADEVCFLDISASHEGRGALLDIVRRTADAVAVPLTVGGGVRTVDDVRALLDAGADKVSINTAAVENPFLVDAVAERYGCQVLVVAIDAKREPSSGRNSRMVHAQESPSRTADGDGDARALGEAVAYGVYTHGGRRASGRDALAWAREVVARGAGEILLTSMDRDGTREGYDLALTRQLSDGVSVPVIASGGVGNLAHVRDGFVKGHADAALAASIFHDGDHAIGALKVYLRAQGVWVRPPPEGFDSAATVAGEGN